MFYSVIIPVYCVEESLLRACLDSLKEQDFQDVEFIVVDDASPDSSGDICKEYEKADERFRVVSLEKNRGLAGARNAGLEEAQGEYIMFVDGDDRVPEGFLGRLAQYLGQNSDDDIVCFASIRNPSDEAFCHGMERHELPTSLSLAEGIISHDEFGKQYPRALFPSASVKVYKRSFLMQNDLAFQEGFNKGEDRIFMVAALSFSPKMSYFDCVGYVYIINPASLCHKYDPDMIEVCKVSCDAMEKNILLHYDEPESAQLLKALDYMRMIFSRDAEAVTFLHPNDNPAFLRERRENKAYWKERSQPIAGCSLLRIRGKRNQAVLALRKMHLYSLAYYIECIYAKVRQH